MIELMRNGGFPMYFILGFGLVALVAAGRFAVGPRRARLPLVRAMSAATLFATLSGTAGALGATFLHVAGDDRYRRSPDWHLFLVQGLGESMSAGIMGFTFLALVAFLCAVGIARSDEEIA